jgi:hypothetical protein
MSDVHPTSDDELVSAYLDGEATPAERAEVEGRPDLVARVTQLGATAARVAATDPPDPDRRAAAIGAALAAFDDQASATGRPGDDGVVGLDAHRRRRAGRLAWLGAAAAVVLVVVVGAAVLRTRSQTATSRPTAAEVAGPTSTTAAVRGGPARAAQPDTANAAAGASGAGGAASGAAADSAAGSPPVTDYGSFADQTALVDALQSRLGGQAPTAAAGAAPTSTQALAAPNPPSPNALAPLLQSASSCDAAVRTADPSLDQRVSTGVATVGGQPVAVDVYTVRATPPAATPTTRAVVVSPSCAVLATVPS